MAQGGSTDGGYGESARGGRFADESFALSHDGFGVLSMANAGPDTNGSQFFITFGPQPHLDGKHVVFGEVISGDSSLDYVEQQPTGNNDKPVNQINIIHSGQLIRRRKALASDSDDSDSD